MEHEDSSVQIDNLLSALERAQLPVVFTMPNADTGGSIIHQKINRYVQIHENASQVVTMGSQGYFSLMKRALAMVGNSSSGIIEAPSFGLPVVNIGSRQEGRIMAPNIICCGNEQEEISNALNRAISDEFRTQAANTSNPYYFGGAAQIIINQLKASMTDPNLVFKHFYDLN